MQISKTHDLCTGCSACASSCPRGCITMTADEKGFLYPQVDESKCVRCGLCQKHCPTYAQAGSTQDKALYSFILDKKEPLQASSSGGAFYAMAEGILAQGGFVCGAVFARDWSVRHILSDQIDDIVRMQGSKYVQSELGSCFAQIKEKLSQGIPVLFVGTPCQVLGIKSFLGKDYENLYLADFICHGVPSPKVWQDYVKLLEAEFGALTQISFRHKKHGWRDYGLYVEGEKKTDLMPHKGNVYLDAFLDGVYHRPSCHTCPVKTVTGYCSDITLGDFWSYDKLHPERAKDIFGGVSAVIVNTSKGRSMLDLAGCEQEDLEQFSSYNRKYLRCTQASPKAALFWSAYKNKNLASAYQLLYRKPLKTRIKMAIKAMIKK